MRYRLLGHSGLRVSELCLGTMTFGDDWGWGAAPEESRRIFDAYVDAGGNFIDTADIYTDGTSEKLVGEFVAADRGLGFLINVARGNFDTPLMFVALLTLVVIALLLYLVVVLAEALLLRWNR